MLLGLLGGLVGVSVAWVAMPGVTQVDDAWGYAWLGMGIGCGAGLVVARQMSRRPGSSAVK